MLYPATTSDSVSAWSNGVRLDSRINKTTKQNEICKYRTIKKKLFWIKTKSLKLTDCAEKAKILYTIVIKISRDIIWTRPLKVPMTAYLDLLKNPVKQKKMLLTSISIRWIKISESRLEKSNKFAPKIKCCEKANCEANKNDKKIGASSDEGLGIKKMSLVTNLTKSRSIWNTPFRPIKIGPSLLWA